MSLLLRLSRLGRAALSFKQLDMKAMIRDIVKSAEFQIKEAEVDVRIDDLPPCRGDATQINQVFSNLVDNALKYLDPSRRGIIRISGDKREDRVVYSVSDNGIGIVPEHQEKVFEIFHRLDATSGSGEVKP